ncbi:hypothetical protein M0R45_020626 [Rubus argutus]|uniref:Uncharacterized protein n=1 Tax=Rubus argutus TaxID=59490 RepID=A0AAW1X8Y8_RUBAR
MSNNRASLVGRKVMLVAKSSRQNKRRAPESVFVIIYSTLEDVGKPKAEVAAKRVMQRVSGANIVPHCCRIEDKLELEFYSNFSIIAPLVLIPLKLGATLILLLVAFWVSLQRIHFTHI